MMLSRAANFCSSEPPAQPASKSKGPNERLPHSVIPLKVVTIDGPAGSGKSTVSRILASQLGWIYVNTGSIYRTLALMLVESRIPQWDDSTLESFVKNVAQYYRQDSHSGRVFLGEREVTDEIRAPQISENASIVAQNELLRMRLLPVQRRVVLDCNGAVVDGRDMGTVVFPDAPLKIFLTATPEQRASRRAQELQLQNNPVKVSQLIKEIYERDSRDANRSIAPMRAADDAICVDSTHMDSNAVIKLILNHCIQRNLVTDTSILGP